MATDTSRTRFALLALLALVLVAMLSVAGPAQAQLPGICNQYPDDPSCHDPNHGDVGPTHGGNDSSPSDVAPDSNGGVAPNGSVADLGNPGGNLPFTGYPLSPLVMLALLLLLAGLVVRAVVELRKRALSGRHSA